jgi:DNA helicase-2/ATP-dependent DNA helicase PcrA
VSLLDGLNDRQREAVEHRGSPLIVLAGPGTGKTRVITHRIAHLIEGGARPDSIAAMTFTNKAAAEMRERLESLVGSAGDLVVAGTFHSLGLRWLARFGDAIGVPTRLQLIDSAQRRDLLEDAVIEAAAAGRSRRRAWRREARGTRPIALGLDQQAPHRRRLRGRCRRPGRSLARADRIAARRLGRGEARGRAGAIGRVRRRGRGVRRFEKSCAARGLATFDDYILLPIRILRESADAAAIIRDEVRHVVVDEYQDVNGAQLELLKLLAPPTRSPDLCVVGDDDQAIYGFRGSDTRAFEHFANIWTDSTTITLDANYRSTPAILDGSQRIIAKAETRFVAEKALEANGERAGDASPIEAVHVDKGTPWGGVIAPMILADRAASDRGYDSYAVIASTHSKLEEIADQLALAGIPVARSRRPSALDDEAVQDLLEWVRLLVEGQAYAAARLLTRPPMRMPRERSMRLRRDHRRAAARANRRGPTRRRSWPGCATRTTRRWRGSWSGTTSLPSWRRPRRRMP